MPISIELIPDDYDEADDPRPTLRRHTDRCFFGVEEVLPHADGTLRGFLVDGVLVGADRATTGRGFVR